MSEVIKTEDNSNDQHVIDDVYDGVEEDKNNEQTRAPVAEEATPAAPPKEEKKEDEDKATMEKVAAMSVMFPSVSVPYPFSYTPLMRNRSTKRSFCQF